MNIGLFVLAVILIPLYFYKHHWFIYLYYVVGICWSVAFSVTYLVSDYFGISNTAILIILVVLNSIGCGQLLLSFYRVSTKVANLKVYALEYIIFAIMIIGCFALSYESINRKALFYLEEYQKKPTLEMAYKLNDYLQHFGMITEQANLELQKDLLEEPAQGLEESFNTKSSLFDMFYFSTVSYLTVGYGDYLPSGWLVRSLVLIEVFVGHISTAILLVIGITKIIKKY